MLEKEEVINQEESENEKEPESEDMNENDKENNKQMEKAIHLQLQEKSIRQMGIIYAKQTIVYTL